MLATSRATLLNLKGEPRAAAAALTAALEAVPEAERPAVWKAQGELYRHGGISPPPAPPYEAWTRAQPKSPEPRLALYDLAREAGDDDAATRAVAELKAASPDSYHWRQARARSCSGRAPAARPPTPPRSTRPPCWPPR